MTVHLSAAIPRIFKQAWRRFGKPYMHAVPPIASWTLPAGYSHSDNYDGILTAGGDVLTDMDALDDYYATSVVYIVPSGGKTADVEAMVAAGIVPAGLVDLFILDADYDTVRQAHALKLNGEWYDRIEVARAVEGSASPLWARVRLQRRS